MRRVDLHVHSTASDGEHPPAEVVRRAAAAGLDVIALTDHDTIAGVREARAAGETLGVRVIAGCEFSVRAPWGELHLLSYFLPLGHADLEAFLAAQRGARAGRMDEIVRRLQAAGVEIARSDVERVADGGALGRPHAARALIERGAVPDLTTAFRRYLGRGRPAFVEKELPPVAAVTVLVRGLGGVTSAAHLKDRGVPGTLGRLRRMGVDAVEVRHPAHDADTAARIEYAARELGLLSTGGSDWHGEAREPDPHRAPLGGIPVPPEWLDRLEQLHRQRVTAEVTT